MVLKGKNIGQVNVWLGAMDTESKELFMSERIGNKDTNFSNYATKIKSDSYEFSN